MLKSEYNTIQSANLLEKAAKMESLINTISNDFKDDISLDKKVNYVIKILGYEKVSAFSENGYSEPHNCLVYSIDSDPKHRVFIKVC